MRSSVSATTKATVARAKFRAWRRGFREADLILGPFADRHAPAMNAAELARFERLMDQPDHDLYAWVCGTAAAPSEFDDDILASLRAFYSCPPRAAEAGG